MEHVVLDVHCLGAGVAETFRYIGLAWLLSVICGDETTIGQPRHGEARYGVHRYRYLAKAEGFGSAAQNHFFWPVRHEHSAIWIFYRMQP
jgi:hypothetical protein